jgi:hypothetical protein
MNDIYPFDKDDNKLKKTEEFQYQDDYGRFKFRYVVVSQLNGKIKLFIFELLILYFMPLVLSLFSIIKSGFLPAIWSWSLVISLVIFLYNKYSKINKFFTIALFAIYYLSISIFSIFYLIFSSFFYIVSSFVALFLRF